MNCSLKNRKKGWRGRHLIVSCSDAAKHCKVESDLGPVGVGGGKLLHLLLRPLQIFGDELRARNQETKGEIQTMYA